MSEILDIMLKGAADYSDIEEIEEKIQKIQQEGRPLRIKLGLDPSAPDIHLGHAVVLRKVRQMQDLGFQAIIIIGDFTGMIGDPTGKSKARVALTKEQVKINAKTYEEQVFKILKKEQTELRFNSDWLGEMNFHDVIQLASKSTVARMLERDDFANRYQKHMPISLHEFFYPLMQAYDSVAIRADLEIGGTDQKFNILMGRNIQRDYDQEPQITLFMPLLEGIDGVEKMSKSLGNYIGVDEDASVIYEKVMKIPDSMILRYYTLCTDLHPKTIAAIEQRLDAGENPRDIKMELAKEIARLYSDEEQAQQAEENFKKAFQQNVIPENAQVLTLPAQQDGSAGYLLIDALVEGGYYKSKGEVRRLIQQGAVQINGEKTKNVNDLKEVANDSVLKIGKGKFFSIQLS